MNKTALSILAHPDDAEFVCAGTLALLADLGWQIHIATLTPGDCGSDTLPRNKIAQIRKKEAEQAANIISAKYHCLESEDAFIMYDKPTLQKVISLIRTVKPAIVFTASPVDYFTDHEHTSKLARTACFTAAVPNVEAKNTTPHDMIPYLYYADPMDTVDNLGNQVTPSIYVDISTTIDTKEKMLCCHKSQRDWLLKHHKMDKYLMSMKQLSQKRGSETTFTYAEGFRQHLGHAYPSDNILKTILPDKVK